MQPTSAEKMRGNLINKNQQQSEVFNKKQSILTPRALDHSPDFFYHVSNDKQCYRRNRDQQSTEKDALSRSAKLTFKEEWGQMYNSNVNQQYDSYNQPIYATPKRYTSPQQKKLFHESNIFSGEKPKRPEPKQSLSIDVEVIPNNHSHQSKPLTNRQEKSPIGALVNKMYNSTVPQHSEETGKTVKLNVEGSPQCDHIEMKRQLNAEGYQVNSIQFPHQPITNELIRKGVIEVRISDSQERNIDQLQKKIQQNFGLQAKIVEDNHKIPVQNKTWVQQKISYHNIGLFSKNAIPRVVPMQSPQTTASKQTVIASAAGLHKHLHRQGYYHK